MIPTAILAGFLLGLWYRWWAVLVVAAGWTVVIAVTDASAAPAAGLLGAVNAAVGLLPALMLRRPALR